MARLSLPVTLVRNQDFRDGNLVSLLAARAAIGDRGFLLMNVDHIYRPAIAGVAAAPADDVTAFIDHDRTLGADDMKVARDGQGRISLISIRLKRGSFRTRPRGSRRRGRTRPGPRIWPGRDGV